METFRTIVNCSVSSEKIGYETPILMLGSCFTESLSARMKQFKFNVVVNPFGIVYHPVPAAVQLDRIITGKIYKAKELQKYNDLWISFDHHGRFTHPDVSICLKQINDELQKAHEQLTRSDWLFITFGTAWAYRLRNKRRIVANCHKYPAQYFERIRLDDDRIYAIWSRVITRLWRINPAIKIVFTISPIRHLNEGAHENQLSKSILLLAVDRLVHQLENTGYFPAYELVLDDLRDYRFYAEDMKHPNDLAVSYIWQHFCESYMTDCTLKTMKTVEDIVKAAAHKPIHKSLEYRKFADNYLKKIFNLKQQYPQFDFSKEIERFES